MEILSTTAIVGVAITLWATWLIQSNVTTLSAASLVHVPAHLTILITRGALDIDKLTVEYLQAHCCTLLVTVRAQTNCGKHYNRSGGSVHPILWNVTSNAQKPTAVARVKTVLQQTKTQLIATIDKVRINREGDLMTDAIVKGNLMPTDL